VQKSTKIYLDERGGSLQNCGSKTGVGKQGRAKKGGGQNLRRGILSCPPHKNTKKKKEKTGRGDPWAGGQWGRALARKKESRGPGNRGKMYYEKAHGEGGDARFCV